MSRMFAPKPVTLTGSVVRLEPLLLEHAEELTDAAQAEEIWDHTADKPRTIDLMESYIQRALEQQNTGATLPFAVRHLQSGKLIGSTRYWDIAEWRRGLQIGFTWYERRYWGSGVNIDSKYLLLKHAFEDLDTVRVEFQTSTLNTRAQKAILRLGAQEEGILRARIVRSDGQRFDSIFYSILDTEWKDLKSNLETMVHAASGMRI
jgi:RimJ/RimL family protein N-acetyltransferase